VVIHESDHGSLLAPKFPECRKTGMKYHTIRLTKLDLAAQSHSLLQIT